MILTWILIPAKGYGAGIPAKANLLLRLPAGKISVKNVQNGKGIGICVNSVTPWINTAVISAQAAAAAAVLVWLE